MPTISFFFLLAPHVQFVSFVAFPPLPSSRAWGTTVFVSLFPRVPCMLIACLHFPTAFPRSIHVPDAC